MPQDVTALKISAICRFLEHQIFREMFAVVAHMQARHKRISALAFGYALRETRYYATRLTRHRSLFDPENPKVAQLFHRQRIRRTRITPIHIPSIFEEDCAHIFPSHSLVK